MVELGYTLALTEPAGGVAGGGGGGDTGDAGGGGGAGGRGDDGDGGDGGGGGGEAGGDGDGEGGRGEGGDGGVGGGGGGGDGAGELDVDVPKFCAQYIDPLPAAPIPIDLKFGFSMFARWPGDPSQALTTSVGVL